MLSLIVNPAILPPVNNTLLPVTSPFPLTLNFEDDIKNWVPPVADPEIKTPLPVIASRVIANPPMFPVVAFMLPVTLTEPLNNADEAVTSPFALTLNLLELIKKSFPVAEPDIKKLVPLDKVLLLIVNPAILPPVNNTLLPVTSPFPLTLNLLELIKKSFPVAEPDIKTPEPVIAFRVIAKPPIFPESALIFPVTDTEPENNADDAVTSPDAFTLNFGEYDPPNVIVPSFKSNTDPSVVLQLFERISPVVIVEPSILVLPPVEVLDNRD